MRGLIVPFVVASTTAAAVPSPRTKAPWPRPANALALAPGGLHIVITVGRPPHPIPSVFRSSLFERRRSFTD